MQSLKHHMAWNQCEWSHECPEDHSLSSITFILYMTALEERRCSLLLSPNTLLLPTDVRHSQFWLPLHLFLWTYSFYLHTCGKLPLRSVGVCVVKGSWQLCWLQIRYLQNLWHQAGQSWWPDTTRDTMVLQVGGGRDDDPTLYKNIYVTEYQWQKGGQVPPRNVVPTKEEDIWIKSAMLKEGTIVTNTTSNS
jgi:hypothetical protein